MPDNFTRYDAMRSAGVAAVDVYRAAADDGIDAITRIRLIRIVFALSPGQAKQVMIQAEGQATSLDEYQGKIAEAVSNRSDEGTNGTLLPDGSKSRQE
jgi:hypothetical protein